jgi:hypothetical protein
LAFACCGLWWLLLCLGITQAQTIPESYQQAAENQHFTLFVDEGTLAIKLLDKRSGFIWHSNLDEVSEDDNLNKTWTAFARSGLSIDYLDQQAKRTRASLSNTNQSTRLRYITHGFEADIDFLDPSIRLTLQVQLEASGLSVEIPFASLQENDPKYRLGVLHLYPFFAAVKEDSVSGYMLIPDGSGTLIPFAASTKASTMFYGRYYGADLGMISKLPHDPMLNRPYTLSLPVSGIVHGTSQAFISVIEKGATYAELVAHPAGLITKFNFLYNSFIYNESYFQATNRSGDGITILQPATNSFDIKVHYRFLQGSESDYVGMARSYQSYLLEQGLLPTAPLESSTSASNTPASDIGIRLEVLGSEKEKVLFWHRPLMMTTLGQMQTILDSLDLPNPQVIYYGWQPLGASSMTPSSLKLEPSLGSRTQLENLIEGVKARGGTFYFYLHPLQAYKQQRGYNPRSDLAMSITTANLESVERNQPSYYFNLEAVQQHYTSLSKDLANLEVAWALDGIGSVLYSDFGSRYTNREQVIQQYQTLLADTKVTTAFYRPNDYVFAHTSSYFDIPLDDSGYIYTSGSVPFLQVVLAGYIPYYGPPLNFSSNLRRDLLRHADYGTYPSFFLTQEVTAKLLNTRSSWIYTSALAQWEQDIKQSYAWLNSLLGPVGGASITARQTLAPGVVATTYSNNKQIIVNYTNQPFNQGPISLAAQDALLREVP